MPRQHSIIHYYALIRLFGAPNGLCSSITESKHIRAVKEPWRRSNRNEALGQMLITNRLSEVWSGPGPNNFSGPGPGPPGPVQSLAGPGPGPHWTGSTRVGSGPGQVQTRTLLIFFLDSLFFFLTQLRTVSIYVGYLLLQPSSLLTLVFSAPLQLPR